MKEYIKTKVKVSDRSLKVSAFINPLSTKNIKLISIDLSNRHCEIWGTGYPETSIYLEVDGKDIELELPEFASWNLFACNIQKYTLNVVLVKE